jgi:hypothetical protein
MPRPGLQGPGLQDPGLQGPGLHGPGLPRVSIPRIGLPRLGLAITMVAAAYLAYPYVTLYRLDAAVHRGDARAVIAAVDWDSVRAGIAEDVARRMAAPAPDALPAFGASFATGVARTALTAELTPAAFVQRLAPGQTPQPQATRLDRAFFDGPTRFVAVLRTQAGATVRLQLRLIGTRWVVTRAWLPAEMLGP